MRQAAVDMRMVLTVVKVAVVVGTVGLGFAPSVASAHVIMGQPSLHLQVAEAELVIRGRVTDPARLHVSADGSKQRRLIEVEPIEVIKGQTEVAMLRVAQDGHDPPRYRAGDEAIFFLRPIERSRELRSLAVDGGASHVSSQEHDEGFLVEAPHGPVLLSSLRSFARSESAPDVETRVRLIREATLDLLTSGSVPFSTAALAGLVLAPHAALVTPSDLPRLERLLTDRATSVGLKAGLIAELERRRLIDGPDHWLRLLEGTPSPQLPTAIRAVAARPSPAIRAHLIALLEENGRPVSDSMSPSNPDPKPTGASRSKSEPRTDSRPDSGTLPAFGPASEIAAEAAMALASMPSAEVIEALARALEHPSARVRNAAIRALSRIATEPADRVLERAAQEHADPATRKRAGAARRAADARAARSATGSP